MKKLFVANYKMNGDKNFYQKINKIVNKLKVKDTVILCPPFVYMPFFKIKNKSVFLGSQDICTVENKKSTGQISARMLKEFDVKYSIIGHSEKREIGETDYVVSQKVEYAQQNGLIPIVCVGEKTKSAKLEVVIEQVKMALANAKSNDVIFAYEPIWAIGTGEQPSVNKINKAIKLIKGTAKECGFDCLVLYGGSVNLSSSKELNASNADGYLMGGVSHKIDEFVAIVKGEWWKREFW